MLILPDGIADRLTTAQLDAVIAHELCHIRRRDNLFAAIHMAVQAIFWFHPLVWWIGARLIDERERACDEDVLHIFGEPQMYAEAILEVCRRYAESPIVCVSGVGGSSISRRIEAIMRNQTGETVTLRKKIVLAVAILLAVGLPVGIGVLNPSRVHAEAQPSQGFGLVSSGGAGTGSRLDVDDLCCPEYLNVMLDRIRTQWRSIVGISGSTLVGFTIQRDGNVTNISTEQSSGYAVLDLNAVDAVRGAGQLPELPGAFPNPTLSVHLNFQYIRPDIGPGRLILDVPVRPLSQDLASAADQSGYGGTWVLVPDSVVGHIPGLPPAFALELQLSRDQLAVRKERAEEIYLRDGTETDLTGYRKGRLAVNDGALDLTTVRVRPGNETVTIVSDRYVVAGPVLIVTRTLRVERPKGVLVDTPQNRWESRYTRR